MYKLPFILVFVGLTGFAAAQQRLDRVPVHDKPVWQQVQSVPESQAQAPHPSYVEVKSLATHQVLGWVPVGYKFLSFGSGQGLVTMSLNGEIGYVPRSVVARMYPPSTRRAGAPQGPVTLEELAAEYENRVQTGAGVSLSSESSIVETVRRETEMMGEGAIPGEPGLAGAPNAPGIDPTMPGAALATGGPQALGDIVGGGPNPGHF